MLPKIDKPIYELTLPVSKQKIKYIPFTVKERSILMLALDGEQEDIIRAIKQIIKNCCVSDIDVDGLSLLDIEYFFLNLRSKSIGGVITQFFTCKNKVQKEGTETECNSTLKVLIDIQDIAVDMSKFNDIIHINNAVGIKLKYPNFELIPLLENLKSNTFEDQCKVIISCIEYIFDDDNLYYPHETPEKEMIDFLQNLMIEKFEEIKEFFENLPKVKKVVNVKCKDCGFEHTIEFEGIESFFG